MENKFDMGDLFTNGENYLIPTPKIHYYQNKQLQLKESQYLIPTYNWTITPIPNWTYSIVTISHFQCTAPSTWLINYVDPNMRLDHQLEKDVGYKVFQSQNPTVFELLHEKEELGQTRFPVTHFFTLVELCSCATFCSS